MSRSVNFLSTVIALSCVASTAFAQKAGQHKGEKKQLEVDISFSRSYGVTETTEHGTYYRFWGFNIYEDKVYIPEYRGTYPLYFFNTRVGVTVKVTNNGPRKKTKLCIKTESYVLHTDGSSGVALCEPREIEVVIGRGETVAVDASFVAAYSPDAESGLDRFLVKVTHPNEGGGGGGAGANSEPALIAVEEGIFCPPEYQGPAMEILDTLALDLL